MAVGFKTLSQLVFRPVEAPATSTSVPTGAPWAALFRRVAALMGVLPVTSILSISAGLPGQVFELYFARQIIDLDGQWRAQGLDKNSRR
jgi:hypothetical protein